MIFLSYIVIVLGYISLLVFILGMAYRVWNWTHRPIGFNWELFPKPTNSTFFSLLLGRILAIPTLFKSDKQLLLVALAMHLAIITSIFLHLELFTSLGRENIIDITGSTAGTLGIVLVSYFIFRRIILREARELTSFADYFWLSVLLLLVALGTHLRIGNFVEPEAYRTFAVSVITFKPALPPPNLWFLTHALIGEIYLMYIVAGKMMHSIGWFFAQYIMVSERQ